MKNKLPTYGIFLGIGGIGMSALARYCAQVGMSVWGYDKTPSRLTDALIAEGISISFDDDVNQVPEEFLTDTNDVWVVFTPAIPADSVLRNYFEQSEVKMMKRAELLGTFSQGMNTLAIAGTHGKTSSTTMAAWLLENTDEKGNAFLGGIAGNFNSNLLVNTQSDRLVVEADEFDRSFLTLSPNVAVVTATDPDHLDIYSDENGFLKSFNDFAHKVVDDGVLIVNEDAQIAETPAKCLSYGWKETNDFYPVNCVYNVLSSTFDLVTPNGVIENITITMAGKHNVINAVGVIAGAKQWGVSNDAIRKAFGSFKGIKRRFEHVCKMKNGGAFIDDYAHHPKEIETTVEALRAMFPNKRLTGVFQPHLYSRTQDFADGFAQALSKLDELVLLDIYPAREKPIKGVTSEWLFNKIDLSNKYLSSKDALVQQVQNLHPEVLITLGAGDIDRLVEPLKEALS